MNINSNIINNHNLIYVYFRIEIKLGINVIIHIRMNINQKMYIYIHIYMGKLSANWLTDSLAWLGRSEPSVAQNR